MRTSTSLFFILGISTLALPGCGQDAGTSPDIQDPVRGLAVQEDVETLIGGSMAGWWRAAHGRTPGPALSTAADAHTSSWRNFGMLDAGTEPRLPLRFGEGVRFDFVTPPWIELNRTLASVRDGMVAIRSGVELGEDGSDTPRAVAFGSFMQGMTLGLLAVLYDEAFVVDENVPLGAVSLAPYPEVMNAALAKLDAAIELAEANTFTIPSSWIGFAGSMDQEGLARLARSYRARLRLAVARSPAEREGVDWDAVIRDVDQGIVTPWEGAYDGDHATNWAWAMDKILAGGHPAWGRLDYRAIGPADASGGWERWINSPPAQRRPFVIDTDDRRITGGAPDTPGTYVRFYEEIAFLPRRGTDHFSFYADTRWAHLLESRGVGVYPDFPTEELEFIRAEALYHMGDREGAMAIVNRWRAHGELPPFTDPHGVAPGGERCVPQTPSGACGDLWEALKYEKRIELFHYGPFTEYTDDRGWGDLVPGTFTTFPAPSDDFTALLADLYGLSRSSEARTLGSDTSPEAIQQKRAAYEAYDRQRNENPGDAGAG